MVRLRLAHAVHRLGERIGLRTHSDSIADRVAVGQPFMRPIRVTPSLAEPSVPASRITLESRRMVIRFSLITSCRANADASQWLRGQQSDDTELIIVSNPGRCGLGAAYNEGLVCATGDYCCFLHDDVSVEAADWLRRLQGAVEEGGYDLVGVAGATRLPFNGAWWEAGPGFLRGVVDHHRPNGTLDTTFYGPPDDPQRQTSDAVSLDGILLFGPRRHFLERRFDVDRFDGFHFYDSDLCLRWLLWDGRRLGVVHDLGVRHEQGAGLQGWQRYLERFHERHGGFLPVERPLIQIWRDNLAALQQADPRIANQLLATRRPGRSLTFERQDGVVVVRGASRTPIVDPSARDAGVTEIDANEEVVLQGAGSGVLLDHVLRETSAKLRVIEPEAHLICWLLCRYDWSDAIRSGRLIWRVPVCDLPELAEVALRRMAYETETGTAHAIRSASNGSARLHEDLFRPLDLRDEIGPGISAKRAEASADWSFDVTVVSPNCAIFDDLARCFEQLGQRTRLLRIPDNPGAWSEAGREEVVAELVRHPSRVTLFRNRQLLETTEPARPESVENALPGRLVSWWWDVPKVASRIDYSAAKAAHPALAIAKDMLPLLPAGSAWHPAGARSPFVAAAPASDDAPFRYAGSFVGQSRFDTLGKHLGVLANALAHFSGRPGRQLADDVNRTRGLAALHRLLADRNEGIVAAIGALEPMMPDGAYYLDYLWRMSLSIAFRLAAIERLAGQRVMVFGDYGWVRSGVVSRDRFGGLLKPEKLPDLYRESRLSLNLDFMQVSSGVHPKIFDAGALGAALLTDERPELAEIFPNPSVRPFVFSSIDELPDRFSDLSKRDLADHRRALRDHVLESHTLQSRAGLLINQWGMAKG